MASQVLVGGRAHQPCAACKMLRRRCRNNCVLAPYFPTHEIEKFAVVHKVFGASNVIKMIQMVEESKREDAVKAIIFEATARLGDPVYGSAGPVFQLQKMVQEFKLQLESIRAQVLQLQGQREQLLGILMNNIHPFDSSSLVNDPVLGSCSFPVDDDTAAYDPITFHVEPDMRL
ncbi:hypothetical protein Tsubulata_048382 [Turnera subulata]|uniref:LOB domain-containing protein n=1 Tax=Turnera subulata TaxID=218843 RepID=A0A9Q0JE15_9ROSI|nr:hypothetical protein Tsubulata_048382 [Turnera subulata]